MLRNISKVTKICYEQCVKSLRNVELDSTEKDCITSCSKKYKAYMLYTEKNFIKGMEEQEKSLNAKAFPFCGTNNPFQNTI